MVKMALAEKKYVDINLLKSETLLRYKASPDLLRREIEFQLKGRIRS